MPTFTQQVVIQSFIKKSYDQSILLNKIDSDMFDNIRKTDQHPYFQAYVLCHEGESSPRIVGEGHKAISWPKRAIQSLSNVSLKGIKFFQGHNKDSSHKNRKEFGKVVGEFQDDIEGKLSHVVIGYHPPEVKELAKKFDVVSQEGLWNLIKDGGKIIADSINKMTGIALGNSDSEAPAFEGALKVGFVQAFNIQANEDVNIGGREMPETKITSFIEIREACERMKIFPSQLFGIDDLKADRNFSGQFVTDEVKTSLADFEKLRADYQGLETKYKESEKSSLLSTAKTRMTDIMKTNNIILTEEQKPFIDKIFEKSKSTLDLSDESLTQFIKDGLDTYQLARGIEGPEAPLEPGQGPQQKDDEVVDKTDFTDPANNELL